MTAPDRIDMADTPPDTSPDADALFDSLRAAGADRFDPVRLHYLEVLAKRANAHDGSIRRMLDARLVQALEAFKARFECAQREAGEAVERHMVQYPYAASDLQRLFAAGDFHGLRQLIATLKDREYIASLRALVRRLDHHPVENPEQRVAENGRSRPELKTIRKFRSTWAKLSADKQVAKALEHAPSNAGPINSHMLVLRSLALMRDISPDYLNRFLTYADTLLSLDQGEKEKPAAPKKQTASRAAKK